ncbi:class I SAM-dependent methyltransferase [Nocardioides mesophilus]|uniref:Methyltransferase domain-containing protein n=1 Tax=Nocardioides mesophilus TaxID=433659 RepID=A0A7G9R7S5_9ACTN|nr:class I SAM-dependent methyltransferase [Nocardioides mesophilus]QNN51650.1 methyltransferase domain-containing protein [Nocardioides mesophilus]
MDARDWDERYAGTEMVWSAGPNQFVASELAGLRPGRAVDLAAGEGRNAIWLAEQGWEVTAVDFSLIGLEKGRRALAVHPAGADLHVDWVHSDVLEWTPGPVGYDLALMAYLQIPADQLHTAVRHAFTALVPGGTLFVVAHDSTNLTEGTGGPQDPDVLYTAEDVLAALDGERFDVERAERVARTVPAADGHGGEPERTAYDALVRLVRTA